MYNILKHVSYPVTWQLPSLPYSSGQLYILHIIFHQPNFPWNKGSFPSKNATFCIFSVKMRSRFKFRPSPGGTDARKGWSVADCVHVTLVCQKVPPLELGFPALLWVVSLSISTRFLWETAQNKKIVCQFRKTKNITKAKNEKPKSTWHSKGVSFESTKNSFEVSRWWKMPQPSKLGQPHSVLLPVYSALPPMFRYVFRYHTQ